MKAAEALAASFAIIERDQLAAHVRMADALAGLRVACDVEGETFHVLAIDGIAVEEAGDGAADAYVTTTRGAILELIDGDIGLLDAVRQRKLMLRADISLMVRLARAQRAFAEGTARARAVRTILDRFRATTLERA